MSQPVVGAFQPQPQASETACDNPIWPRIPESPLPIREAADEHETNPVRWPELWSCVLIVALSDLTIYHGHGFAGLALLFVAGPLLLFCGVSQRKLDSFTWLLRRQIGTLAAAIFLYSITPVDALVMQYNVRRILAGDSAPAVQIGFHDIDSEGLLCLLPLVDSPDEKIREGIKALLSERHDALVSGNWPLGWTEYQIADQRLKKQLRAATSQWPDFADYRRRMHTLVLFREHVYQWY